MQNFLDNSNKLFKAAKLYFPSAYSGFKNQKLWDDLETFCLFLGYPRSGHSLIGALLNAHPMVAMSHESAALKYVYLGFSRNQIYDLILKKASLSPERKLGGYTYFVPNQSQGQIKKLKVIGDKQGEGTVLRIAESDRYIERLRQILNIKIKFIHIVRNPYDNIATISRKTPKLGFDIERSIEHYFYLCKVISDFKFTLDDEELIEFKQENFIDEPKVFLKSICDFLGIEASKKYLDDCQKIVYKSPNKSRYQVSWTPQLIDLVADNIQKFSFLQGYSYDV